MTHPLPFAITMGDASGVGPEILLRAFHEGHLTDPVLVYGDAAILHAGCDRLGIDVPLHVTDQAGPTTADALTVVDAGLLTADDLEPGVISKASGAAAREYVVRATEDALAGINAGLVTLPINKEATQLSDPGFCGHTELIARICGTDRYAMMLATDTLACSHVSTHIALEKAIPSLQEQRILEVIRLTDRTLRAWLDNPRIAVAGLNPHAGENGLFGLQDQQIITPAINAARNEGINASGPHPGDTVFYQAVHQKKFDAIIAMYHDQGHIPMKLLAFDESVNTTIGLPIIRTSVDHGTAFDIAWQGKAFLGSFLYALRYAQKLGGQTAAV